MLQNPFLCRLFFSVLGLVKLAVDAAVSEKLGVGSLLDNASVFYDEDFVGGQDGGKTVGDQDAGPGADQGIDGFLD